MSKFTWGDSVRIKLTAPARLRPGEGGEVVAITKIENQHQAEHYDVAIGITTYLVEFGDGQDVTVPESLLERWIPSQHDTTSEL